MGGKQQGKRRNDSGLGGLFNSSFKSDGPDITRRNFENARLGLAGTHSRGGADEAFRAYMEYGKDGYEILDFIKRVPVGHRPRIIQKIKTLCEASQLGYLFAEDMETLRGWIESIRKVINGLDEVIVEIISGLPDLAESPDMLKKIQETRDKFVKKLDFLSQAVVLSEEVSDATEGRSDPESDTGVLGAGEEIEDSPGSS